MAQEEKEINEDLRKWFREKWVDISRKDKSGKHPACGGSAGKGSRAKDSSKKYPKCVPAKKAKSMDKKAKKSAVRRKRQAPNKPGKPDFIKTDVKKESKEPRFPVTFKTATRNWFYENFGSGFSEQFLSVLEENAIPAYEDLLKIANWAPGNCDLASQKWKEIFDANGIESKIVDGHYNPEHEEHLPHPLSSDHVWLEVDGGIFDPSAGQFPGEISLEHYWWDNETKAHSDSIDILSELISITVEKLFIR
jgi:hypothetical protein